MHNRILYFFALILTLLSSSLFIYKAFILRFPLSPNYSVPIWTIESQIKFIGKAKPTKISLFIPSSSKRTFIIDEQFISSGFGLTTTEDSPNRKAVWSIKNANGKQTLFYKAVVREGVSGNYKIPVAKKPELSPPGFNDAEIIAVQTLLDSVSKKITDTDDLIAQLIKELQSKDPDEHIKILMQHHTNKLDFAKLMVKILSQAKIPTRVVNGIRLLEQTRNAAFVYWLEVFDAEQKAWKPYQLSGEPNIPDDYLPWWRGEESLAYSSKEKKLEVTLSTDRNQELALSSAIANSKLINPWILEFSLFSLPVNTQLVYRIILMIPIGAFIIVLLRNIVGLTTFGTFMPVLISLAFRETKLLYGVVLFALIVSIGLIVRFILEKLKLLLVPRLAATLTVVVIIMVSISILSHRLGFESGLSVALFPMVILTMTIERMSITWDELGPWEAISHGLGSLLAAVLCYSVINISSLQHLIFVFPELLLILLAITLLLGRYTGYRFSEIKRFKVLTHSTD